MRYGVEIQDALDAALNAEGEREPSHAASGIRPNQHSRVKVRRLVLRVISELPEDLTVQELREALEE
jgi:hypothetical protein